MHTMCTYICTPDGVHSHDISSHLNFHVIANSMQAFYALHFSCTNICIYMLLFYVYTCDCSRLL